MSSDAVALDKVSRIVGYKLKTGDFRKNSPNLPMRIAIFAEANDANQTNIDLNPFLVTSLQDVGAKYGYGCPIYAICRILKPLFGGGLNGAEAYVYPQAKAGGAAAKVYTITVTGTATANTVVNIVIGGRYGVDASFYSVSIVAGDSPSTIAAKIATVVNGVLGAPVAATSASSVSTLTAKWSGLTSDGLTLSVDAGTVAAGLTFTVNSTTNGSGTPSIAPALALFGNVWNTIVINSYGTNTAIMTALETFNGIPNPNTPTGRFVGIVMKPFIALTGSVVDDPSSITDSRLNDVTIAICPAPGSAGLPMEAAANMAVLFANVVQNTPHLDVGGQSYPDMPTPLTIGSMADYANRDTIVKKGCSTVDLVAGTYQVQDFVTTYHPLGENPPQFRYCRNLMLDFNVRYGYYLLEHINVIDHAIANDSDIVNVDGVIKPKQWLQLVASYADDLVSRSLVVDGEFMKTSITVNISTQNPDRLETFFKYKRSGVVRIASTTAQAGFNFGTLN